MKKILNEELGRLSPEAFALAGRMPVVVVLDNIRSLNNVGSVFRTADAFAVEEVVLCGITATPPSKEIHKTALGAENTVRWSYHADILQAVDLLRSDGYTIVAVEQVEGAAVLGRFTPAPARKYALILGNEVSGVSQQAVDASDMAVEIPQAGTKHSLNISVAAGVVLWDFFRHWQ